jgi:hypothetical protein
MLKYIFQATILIILILLSLGVALLHVHIIMELLGVVMSFLSSPVNFVLSHPEWAIILLACIGLTALVYPKYKFKNIENQRKNMKKLL